MSNTQAAATKLPSPKRRLKTGRKSKTANDQNFTCPERRSSPAQMNEEGLPLAKSCESYEQHATQQELQECAKYLNKLKILQHALEADLLACDAKWTLFVSAAFSYRYDSMLRPWPPTDYNIDALLSVIKDTPKLSVVLQSLRGQSYKESSGEVMDLLYWVLVDLEQPTLRLVDDEELTSTVLSIDKKAFNIKPTHAFEVFDATGFHSDAAFQARTSGFLTKHAFMGNRLDHCFSILHNGFDQMPGDRNMLQLTTDWSSSLKHSPFCAAWGASLCGSIISCTTICELGLDPYVDNVTANENDMSCVDIELHEPVNLRVRYLIFHGRRFPPSLLPKRSYLSWIYKNRFSFSMWSYLLLMASIFLANTENGERYKRYMYKNIELVFALCRRIIGKEAAQ